MDVKKLRHDFPVIENSTLVYFDNACMSLKPRQVIDAMLGYYEQYTSCAGRSNHRLSVRCEDEYQKARKSLQSFIGAKKPEEVVFTRNTTEGLNLVANALDLQKGDAVLTSDREHNSNLIPWQVLKERKGIEHRIVKSKQDFTFDLEAFKSLMNRQVKLVSMVWTSNIDGYTLPVKEIIKIAHDFGALVMLDGAQAVPHSKTDVRKLDVDFLAFSGHKMLGPTGTGILYGKYDLLDRRLRTFMVGGETVEFTTYDTHKFLKPPEKFEAGLQDYAGMIGLGEATRYLERLGPENIERHEIALNKGISERLSAIPNLQWVGIQDSGLRGGIIPFNIRGLKYHDVSLMLDKQGIAIRSGQHCAHSWFNGHGVEGSARASLYLYNTPEEAGFFADAVEKIAKLGK